MGGEGEFTRAKNTMWHVQNDVLLRFIDVSDVFSASIPAIDSAPRALILFPAKQDHVRRATNTSDSDKLRQQCKHYPDTKTKVAETRAGQRGHELNRFEGFHQ
jgi:hypothetical protein